MAKMACGLLVAAAVVCMTRPALAQETLVNWEAPHFWSPPAPSASKGEASTMAAEAIEAVPTPPLPFVGLTPCRLVDTRGNGFTGAYGPPVLTAGVPRSFVLTGRCGISATAQAVSLNVTVTNTQGPGHIVIYPTGGAQPTVSTLNYVAGLTIANAAVVPLGTGGAITVVAGVSGTDLIIDTNGDYRGGVVTSLSGLSGEVNLAAGSNVTITPSGQTLTVAATGGPGGVLPTGTVNQTMRHNGTSWVASNAVLNKGVAVEVTVPLALPTSGEILAGGASFIHKRGFGNTFLGDGAGESATLGNFNTGVGAGALSFTTTGSEDNVAVGYLALPDNTTGDANIAIGRAALGDVSTGSGNIAIGSTALGLTSGSNNLYIGNPGTGGNESGQIRIGNNAVHTQGTVIASIYGFLSSGGIPVYVTSGGRLGTNTSSGRFKVDVRAIGAGSEGLMSLRPVAFRYKPELDPSGLPQYGLIAEEVAEIYPDLVVYDEEGRPEAIRSQLLQPLFLNELQKERRAIDAQRAELDELKAKLEKLEALMRERKN